VVPLAVGQPEEAFFEDGILPVPQRQREAEPLLVVGDPAQSFPKEDHLAIANSSLRFFERLASSVLGTRGLSSP
jgi:hypothetical protein